MPPMGMNATAPGPRARGPRELAFALVALTAVLVPARPAAAAAPQLAWEVIEHDTPAVVWANRTQSVRLRLRNVGSATWSEAAGDHLSYRWLTTDGTVVADGDRTSFAAAVAPGEEVEVAAILRGPADAGAWVLEWGMVREQVRWYGPPLGGEDLRVRVSVWWRSSVLQVGFVLVTSALVLAVRRWPPRPGAWPAALVALLPPVWAALAAGLAALTFSELVGRDIIGSEATLVWSGAALLALPPLALPARWRAWAAFAIAALVGLVTVADLVYLRYFGSVVPLAAFAGIGQVGQIEGSVRALLRASDVWLLPPVAAGLLLALAWPSRRSVAASRAARRASTAVAAAALAAAGWPALAALRAALADATVAGKVFSEEQLVGEWGVLNVHLFDLARTVREWSADEDLPAAEQQRVLGELAARAAQVRPSPAFGAARGASLILIQVESLQRWVVGARVGGVEVTPFLNALPRRALFFSSVFDQTEQGRSSDGEFATLNSLLPLDRGAVVFRRDRNRFVALPGVLRERGYATMSAHPFERGFWNRAVVHPRYGFDRMLFRRELGPGEVIGWGLADSVFFERLAPRLSELPRPYFAMLITLGLHHPFDQFPDRHKVLDVGALKGTPLGNYIHAMHYFDTSLAALVGALEASGTLTDTIVALYGDHEAGIGSPRELCALAGEGQWTTSTNVMLWRVPFFVMLPGGALAGERTTPGGHVDIAPTLLDLLGIERPASFLGASLLGERPFPTAITGGSAVAGDRLFVARGDRVPTGGLCFSFPERQPLPRAACDALAAQARTQRDLSRLVVEHDLAAAAVRGS
jgi:phosphoglycerol transferase MdoB-like AlkP superfamily enzyme